MNCHSAVLVSIGMKAPRVWEPEINQSKILNTYPDQMNQIETIAQRRGDDWLDFSVFDFAWRCGLREP
jgi:hypothetical protein